MYEEIELFYFLPYIVILQFQGISPKLEFRTTSVIKESRSIEQDALEDALLEERVIYKMNLLDTSIGPVKQNK